MHVFSSAGSLNFLAHCTLHVENCTNVAKTHSEAHSILQEIVGDISCGLQQLHKNSVMFGGMTKGVEVEIHHDTDGCCLSWQ